MVREFNKDDLRVKAMKKVLEIYFKDVVELCVTHK